MFPLAILALSTLPARANITFNTGSNCSVSGNAGGGTCSSYQQGAAGGDPFANWVAMDGAGDQTGGSAPEILDFIIASGTASGTIAPGTIPVSWDFSTFSMAGATVDWTVSFKITFSGGGSASFTQTGSTVTNGTNAGVVT